VSRRVRLAFWLRVMDVLAACGLFSSRLHSWATVRASACVDWGDVPSEPGPDPWDDLGDGAEVKP